MFWGILFLRLEGTHLHSEVGVFDGGYYTLLCVKAKLFRAPRDHKSLLEVLKRLPPCDDLLCDPAMSRDDDSVGIVLSPHISIIEVVELRKKEGSILLLRCTILGIAHRTSPHPRLGRGRHVVLAVIPG